jgi:hypothetical protein
LQPLVFRADAESSTDARTVVQAASARFGSPVADRLLSFVADQTRRLGGGEWAERYWLLLPQREGVVAAHAGDYESVDLVS